MSYILDALRKADAARARTAAPDQQARPPRLVFAQDAPARRWPWLLLAAALGLAALAWWSLPQGGLPGRPAAVAAAPALPGAAVAVPEPSAPQPASAASARPADAMAPAPGPALPPVASLAVAPPAPPLPAPVRVPATPSAPPVSAVPPGRPAASVAAAPTLPASQPQQPAPPPVAARAAALAPAVAAPPPLLDELPPELRRDLPALKVSGATFSENPAHRLLILNGQLLHEGDAVAPDLLLQDIGARAATLQFRGRRFRLVY